MGTGGMTTKEMNDSMRKFPLKIHRKG